MSGSFFILPFAYFHYYIMCALGESKFIHILRNLSTYDEIEKNLNIFKEHEINIRKPSDGKKKKKKEQWFGI